MSDRFFLEPMRVEHIPAISAIERLCFPQPWPAHAYRKEIQENRMAYYVVARAAEAVASGQGSRAGDHEAAGRRQEPGDGGRSGAAPHSSSLPTDQQPPATPHEPGLIERLARLLRPASEPLSPELEAELRSIVGYAGLWVMVDEAHVTTIAVHPEFQGRSVGELLLLGLIDYSMQVGAKWMTLEVRVSNEVAQALYRKYTFKEMGVRKGYYSDNREDALVMWTERLDSPAFQEILARNRAQFVQRRPLYG